MEGKAMGKFFKELKNQSRPKTVLMEMFSYIKIFSAAILIAFVLTRCVIVNAETPTSSMENTIMTGDRYFGLRISYLFEEPQRRDIIVFKFPDDESHVFVKRIIGIPGDIVEIKNDTVYVNGEQLEEPYLKEPMSLGQNMIFEVPADSYFVMGDNRNISNDARYWNNTYVKKEQIIGKAMVKYYSGKVTFEVLK
jgi:signal peptidase I